MTSYGHFHSLAAIHVYTPSMAYDDAHTNGNLGYLNAGKPTSRRVSAGTIKGRKASSSFAPPPDDEDGAHGMHSLAHELAVALMPEPSAGQRLLQEEFGIEYDEGAEGIDEPPDTPSARSGSLAEEFNDSMDYVPHSEPHESNFVGNDDLTAYFGTLANDMPPEANEPKQRAPPARDPMDILSRDLESTDKFITQLKQLDSEVASSSSQLSIEKLASDVIRHLNEAARDREGQVRELLVLEREFRKIATEINGDEILGQLDALPGAEGLSDKSAPATESSRPDGRLQAVQEETRARRQRSDSGDWETNPDDLLDDGADYDDAPESPLATKDSFVAPPSTNGPPTVPNILPHVAHVRSLTSTLASSLTAISEHAQVNGAANTDAGRKIRALKNKLGSWRSEQESAEKSRVKIERWEAGLTDDETALPSTPPARPTKRIDARRVTEEHLRAFEVVLAEAGTKTKAIMARS